MLNTTETRYYFPQFTAPEPASNELHPHFTAYPHGGTIANNTEVTLSCDFSFPTSVSGQDPCRTLVTWEHNRTTIDPSSVLRQQCVYNKQDGVYSSTLTIPQFSATTEGDYECRVGEGASTIVSPVATLKLSSE